MNAVITLAIVGAGPAGLMAAETAANAGVQNIHVFDAMPSVGRKLLLAGIGGLNITHSEPTSDFLSRYQPQHPQLLAGLAAFDANALRHWCADLGIDTFVGSSGRVFPNAMKAAPLLRAWLSRLKSQGVQFHSRHRWLGWCDEALHAFAEVKTLRFATPCGNIDIAAQAVVLALGGGSWSKLGSDGTWQSVLAAQGVHIKPLIPANCGFNVAWSDFFKAKCAGVALKNVAIVHGDTRKIGELMLTKNGIEGGLVYAHSAEWRSALAAKESMQHTAVEHCAQKTMQNSTTVFLDLLPNHSRAQVLSAAQHPRGARSLASHLQSRLGLSSSAFTLVRECLGSANINDALALAQSLKALPIRLDSTRPLDEAISSAGGVAWDSLDTGYQLNALPGVFCAGEMLDWEAPTGGYLLTACWATGAGAGHGVSKWLLEAVHSLI
jgi:uncharacterized flavoprotein (TIGR03862 family)